MCIGSCALYLYIRKTHTRTDYATLFTITLTHLAFSFLLGWMGLLIEAAEAPISASSSSSSVLFSSSVAMLLGDPERQRERERETILVSEQRGARSHFPRFIMTNDDSSRSSAQALQSALPQPKEGELKSSPKVKGEFFDGSRYEEIYDTSPTQ